MGIVDQAVHGRPACFSGRPAWATASAPTEGEELPDRHGDRHAHGLDSRRPDRRLGTLGATSAGRPYASGPSIRSEKAFRPPRIVLRPVEHTRSAPWAFNGSTRRGARRGGLRSGRTGSTPSGRPGRRRGRGRSEPVVAEGALLGDVLGGADLDHAERAGGDAVAAAVAGGLLDVDRVELGPHDRAGRADLEAPGVDAVLADVGIISQRPATVDR